MRARTYLDDDLVQRHLHERLVLWLAPGVFLEGEFGVLQPRFLTFLNLFSHSFHIFNSFLGDFIWHECSSKFIF